MRLLALVFLMGLVAGCGQRSQADQDHDSGLVLAAIRAADSAGAELKMDEMLVETGGDISKGKSVGLHATATGTVKVGRSRFTFKPVNSKASFDMVFADGQIYVKSNASQVWNTTPASTTTALYPSLRLTLLEEVVMLGRTSSGSADHLDAGFARRYSVTTSGHQLEQLESIPVVGPAETAFLKSATATVDVYLSSPGDHLMRIAVHMSGTDPATSVTTKVDSVADFKQTGKVGPIEVPAGAVAVTPDRILVPQ